MCTVSDSFTTSLSLFFVLVVQYLMPCGHRAHWWLVVVDHHNQIFDVYDSVRVPGRWKKLLDIVAKNLEAMRPGVSVTPAACAARARRWKTVYKQCQQQAENSVDCGVFTLYHMEKLLEARGAPPDFKGDRCDPKHWRRYVRRAHFGMIHQQDRDTDTESREETFSDHGAEVDSY